MRYLVIGLGIYGSNLARDLTEMGHEVIGADCSATIVDSIKEYISTAYILDSTDEGALAALPLRGVDLVIVAIGEHFGASIKTVALLKKLGVKHIYARAADEVHQSILESMEIDRIITPEQRAARDLSHEMALGHQAEVLAVTSGDYVMRFSVPEYFVGMKYSELELDKDYGLKLVAVARPSLSRNLLGLSVESARTVDVTSADAMVMNGDILVCFGSAKSYRQLVEHIS